jgi:hypothetical protein
MTCYSETTCNKTCTNSGVPGRRLGEPIPEALRESVRELMDPADGPNGEKVALSDASDFFTAV